MGADWYYPFIIFGCEFIIPPEISYRKFIKKLLPLKEFTTFDIHGILPSFHSRMEMDINMDDNKDLDELAYIVIGFEPNTNFDKMIELRSMLLDFLTNNSLLKDFEIVKEPKYYCGIEWHPICDSESSESEFESESASSSDLESVSELSNTTDSEYHCLGDDSYHSSSSAS